MNVLFDSSALFKRYSGEVGAQRVMALQQGATTVTVAAHCRTELASALSRQWRDRLLTDQEYDRLLGEIDRDFEELHVLPLSLQVEQHAIAAMRRSVLCAMEALHIGTARVAHVDLFVTADRRQAQAAQALGLDTEWIEA